MSIDEFLFRRISNEQIYAPELGVSPTAQRLLLYLAGGKDRKAIRRWRRGWNGRNLMVRTEMELDYEDEHEMVIRRRRERTLEQTRNGGKTLIENGHVQNEDLR